MVVHIDPAGILRQEGLDNGVVGVVGDVLDNLDLGVGAVIAVGHGRPVEIQRGDHILGLLERLQVGGAAAEVHEEDHGLPDDIVEGDHDGHGQKAPQAPAHGVDALLGVELLQLLVHLHLVVGVFLLDLLHLAGHPVHTHHALLGLHLEGQQHQLDHQGEEDERQAVGACQVVKKSQQSREGDTDIVSDG